MKKKTNKKDKLNWITIIVLLIIIALIEIISNYCNNHYEEHKKESWDKFERRMQEVHYMTKW